MTLLGYICAVLIGLTLGLFGSGGSILTVPVLVYLLHFSPMEATGYSLFIVGVTSLIGAFTHIRKQLVDYKIALVFTVPSLVSVYVIRRFLLPQIPDIILNTRNYILDKDVLIMVVFALLMIATAISMMRKTIPVSEEKHALARTKIALLGLIVGAITGLVSVGGGFLIIPALVLFAKIPIRMAVGTSLLVIAANALIGFAGELHNNSAVDWMFLIYFTLLSVLGIIAGGRLAQHIPSDKLKPVFGWFILVMGVYIIFKELL